MLDLGFGPVELAATARLYDFGAVTLALRLPAAARAVANVGPAERARPRHRPLRNGREAALAGVAGATAPGARGGPVRPASATLEEDYLIGMVQELDTALTGAELLAELDLVPLLSGEQRPLSEGRAPTC